jgi:drug/metabolite transporter (DMT)-like permease
MKIGKTKWGALIAGVGGIAALVGGAMSNGQPIPWAEVAAIVGAVVAAWGARDAIQQNTDAINRPSGPRPTQ